MCVNSLPLSCPSPPGRPRGRNNRNAGLSPQAERVHLAQDHPAAPGPTCPRSHSELWRPRRPHALGVPRLLTAWPPGRGWMPPPAAPRAVTCPASPCRPQSPPGQGNGCRRAPCRLFQKHGTRPPAGSTWEEPHISPILRLNVSVKPRLRTCPLATAVARPGGHTAQAGGWDDAPLAAVGSGAKDAAGLWSRHKWALA